jgi:hypothetical protein
MVFLLFSKQVAMRTCSCQCQNQNIFINPVDQQPIRLNVAFPESYPATGKSVVLVIEQNRYAIVP